MSRETTVWVDIDTVIPHPDNPNRQDDDTRAKLVANIEATGMMPPIICRSLEESEAFQDEHAEGKIQALDGHQRREIAIERGDKQVEVRIWRGITDARARVLLLTMNRLGGTDDKKVRGRLIRELAEIEDDPDALATLLPEKADDIRKVVEEAAREAVSSATEAAAKISSVEPLTIFVEPAQRDIIQAGIKKSLARLDGVHQHVECEEGAALAVIIQQWSERLDD